MRIKRINLVYFSPTKTTQKIVNALAHAKAFANAEIIDNNLTSPNFETSLKPIESDDLVIFGMPVYAGRVPVEAIERFEKINNSASPVVLIAVYGNRHYDDALIEMRELATAKGMLPIAAGAFIGEHSYSTNEFPVAANRPDENDIQIAEKFAQQVFEKLNKLADASKIEPLNIPGTFPLPERRPLPDAFAETDYDKCIKCKKCIDLCPTGAIEFSDKIETVAEKCIICCACIKACPTNARFTKSEKIQGFSKLLFEKCSQRREPEIFC